MDHTELIALKKQILGLYSSLIYLSFGAALLIGLVSLLYLKRRDERLSNLLSRLFALEGLFLTLTFAVLAYYHLELAGIPFVNPFSLHILGSFRVPPWIESERLLFWIFAMSLAMGFEARKRRSPSLTASLGILLALFWLAFMWTKPFDPFPEFFTELLSFLAFQEAYAGAITREYFLAITPHFRYLLSRVSLYNSPYMWIHPPLLFASYGLFSVNFVACIYMLKTRERLYDSIAYSYGKTGYFLFTMGMLLGYPWALEAWRGASWWWSPAITSSFVLWCLYTAYLHSRIYLKDRRMWDLTALLGILGFLSLLFAYLMLFFVPGAHSYA